MTKIIRCPQCFKTTSSYALLCKCGFNFANSTIEPLNVKTCYICFGPADFAVKRGQFICETHYKEKFAPLDPSLRNVNPQEFMKKIRLSLMLVGENKG